MTPESTQYLFLAVLAVAALLLIWRFFIPQSEPFRAGYLEGYDDGYIDGGFAEQSRWETLHDENEELRKKLQVANADARELREGYEFWKETAEEFGRQLQVIEVSADEFKHVL
jgi:hypothetical protein